MLDRWQATIVDEKGNIRPGAIVQIRSETTGAIATVFKDPDGTEPWPTGFVTADENGYVYFHARPDWYRLTSFSPAIDWRFVNVGVRPVQNTQQTFLTYADMQAFTPEESPYFVQVTNDPDDSLNGYYVWDGSAWERSGVQPVGQAAVDSLEEQIAQTEELALRVNRAAASFDNPNWFTKAQMVGDDLSAWLGPTSTIDTTLVSGETCIRISNGSKFVRIPRSHFEESGLISCSVVVTSLSGGVANNDGTAFRIRQINSGGTEIPGTLQIVRFVDASFSEPRYFAAEAMPLHVDCVEVEYRIQPGTTGSGAVATFRVPVACGGPSALYRDPPPEGLPSDVLIEEDLALDISPNLAKPGYLIEGTYVTNTGSLASGAGWYTYKVPVSAGEDYTFGNFSIATAGYSAFYDDSSLLLFNGSHTTGTLPKTVTAPAGAVWLYVTVARPANSAADWAQTVICLGSELIPYVPAEDTITGIRGYAVAGSVDTSSFARLGEDADFANLEVTSLATGSLIANVPSGAAEPPGLSVNEVWVNETDGTLRVKLA